MDTPLILAEIALGYVVGVSLWKEGERLGAFGGLLGGTGAVVVLLDELLGLALPGLFGSIAMLVGFGFLVVGLLRYRSNRTESSRENPILDQ